MRPEIPAIIFALVVGSFSCAADSGVGVPVGWRGAAQARIKAARVLDFSRAGGVQIELPPDASDSEKFAARLLREELLKIIPSAAENAGVPEAGCETGLPRGGCRKGKWFRPQTARFRFVNTRKIDGRTPLSDLARRNSYSVRVGSNCVELRYPSEDKAAWIVGKFLRGYCGAEYFSPSESGADYGEARAVFGRGEREFVPSYFASNIFDPNASSRWRALNGIDCGGRYFAFSHNLSAIFPRGEFFDNPNFYRAAYIGGVLRRVPSGQPDFLNPQAAEKAAEFVLEKSERSRMVSIGINDSQLVDERPEYENYKRGYFRGFPDWSAAVFEFSNRVAKKVAEQNPNAILGCLAYMICENPPPFKLEKNIVPFFTTDRANYADADYKRQDIAALRRWGECANVFGIYDYLYGFPYVYPRDTTRYAARGIAAAREFGARFYFAETYALWGFDAKKMWIVARMLEDSAADFDLLETEFYRRYYKAAAADMKAFFDIAERVFARRGVAPRWLAFYKTESVAELFDLATIAEMSEALARAEISARRCGDAKVLLRVREAADFFGGSKAAYNLYRAKIALWDAVAASRDLRCGGGSGAAGRASAVAKYARSIRVYNEAVREVNAKYPYAKFEAVRADADKYAPVDAAVSALGGEFFASGIFDDVLPRGAVCDVLRASSGAKREEGRGGVSAQKFEFSDFSDFRRWFEFYALDYDSMRVAAVPRGRAVGAGAGRSAGAASGGGFCAERKTSALEFENCERSGIFKRAKIAEGSVAKLSGRVSNRAGAGTICYAGLVFLDSRGAVLGRKTLIFPSRENVDFVVSQIAPKGAASCAASVFATRQKRGDVLVLESFDFEIF